MLDQPSTRLNEALLDTGQRPTINALGEHQPPPEIPEAVGQTLSTPISRTTRSGSSGPSAPLAAGPPISPPSSAAPARAAGFTTHQIRQYQLARRAAGAATGTINRETSALHRMGTLAVHWGWLDTVPGFPDRLRENPPRQGFFEHPEYLAVRVHLPAPWQDILDLAYYSGWRKQEILGLTWEEIDEAGGVIRLSPGRSKTLVGRILPISPPIAEALARRRARRDPGSPLVFHRDGIPIRRWRTAWRTACQAAGVPTRFLHDCRRTAARNLIPRERPRAGRHAPDRAQEPRHLSALWH